MAKRAGGVSLWRRVTNYVKHDLREIVWPRPMDDPPGTTSVFEGLTARDHARVWSNAWREYKRGDRSIKSNSLTMKDCLKDLVAKGFTPEQIQESAALLSL